MYLLTETPADTLATPKHAKQVVAIKLQAQLTIVMDTTAHAYQIKTESQLMTVPDDINQPK